MLVFVYFGEGRVSPLTKRQVVSPNRDRLHEPIAELIGHCESACFVFLSNLEFGLCEMLAVFIGGYFVLFGLPRTKLPC